MSETKAPSEIKVAAILERDRLVKDIDALDHSKTQLVDELLRTNMVIAKESVKEGRSNQCAVEAGDNRVFVAKLGPIHWRDDDSCSYCGSMSVRRAIELLQTNGTIYSGADWKYGWPHKFYIGRGPGPIKFYNNHLLDASPEEFATFNELSEKLLGIKWDIKNDANGRKLGYFAVPGIQLHGTIGQEANW